MDRESPGIDYEGVSKIVIDIIPGCKIFFVKEYHRAPKTPGDYHYHVIIVDEKLKGGISKNTYKRDFRDAFGGFKGITLDVTGIKSPNDTIKYIFKGVHLRELLEFIDGKNTEHVKISEKKYWMKTFSKCPRIKTTFIAHRMNKHTYLREWQVDNMVNITLRARNIKSIQRIWGIKESVKPPKEFTSKYFEKLLYDKDRCSTDRFVLVCKKYDISPYHFIAFTHVIHGLLLREDNAPLRPKTQRLVIRGESNTGKTTILNAFRRFFHPTIFYEIGSRKNDFSGFNLPDKPLIVWDDCFGTSPGVSRKKLGWNKQVLLKLFGLEALKIDAKYDMPIIVKTNYNVILTNDPFIIQTQTCDENLKARLKLVDLPDDIKANWFDLGKEDNKDEIEALVLTALEILDDIHKSNDQLKILHYGGGRHVVVNYPRYWEVIPNSLESDPIKKALIKRAPMFIFPKENEKKKLKWIWELQDHHKF